MITSELIHVDGFDAVHRVDCAGSVAYVALHALLAGRAFGGIRIRPYPDEAAALTDALDLARAMSRKIVMTGIAGGGGKAVVLEPPPSGRQAALRALGAFVESLGGSYFCGPDLGFTEADGEALGQGTRYVACAGLARATAESVHRAMRTACPDASVVAIQGLGAVGAPLAARLSDEGVRVVGCDVRPIEDRSALFDVVDVEAIYDVACDVFAPCAAGGVLDAATIPRLRCRWVCGGANNPFRGPEDIEALHQRGIGYVPDFIANSGAAIQGASNAIGESDRVTERIEALPGLLRRILDTAVEESRSAHHVAIELADRRIDELRGT